MAELDVTIKVLSPIHLNSGQADVNVDAEIVHDALGFPYFPAKRFKGLLYESTLDIQLIVPNFYILPSTEYETFCAEWKYLQWKYPEIFTTFDVLNSFTSLRYQTRLENAYRRGLRAFETLDAFGHEQIHTR